MKTTVLQLCLVLIMITGLHAMRLKRTASIKGLVLQKNRVSNIWAVQGNDSTEIASKNGMFNIRVRPGIWKIIIHTKDLYPGVKIVDNIETTEGKNTDLGKIDLE